MSFSLLHIVFAVLIVLFIVAFGLATWTVMFLRKYAFRPRPEYPATQPQYAATQTGMNESWSVTAQAGARPGTISQASRSPARRENAVAHEVRRFALHR